MVLRWSCLARVLPILVSVRGAAPFSVMRANPLPPQSGVGPRVSDYEIVIACPYPGASSEEVQVDLSHRFDAARSMESDRSIDAEWARRVALNPKLYDATKFRFAGARYLGSGGTSGSQSQPGHFESGSQSQPGHFESGSQSQPGHLGGKVSLDLGITSYKEFVGTSLSPGWASLPRASLGSALGNAAVVETSDGKVVLLKRSTNVGELPSTLVFPGGHPEPSRVSVGSREAWEGLSAAGEIPSSEAVVLELFDSILAEVEEETGILPGSLLAPTLLGVTRRALNHRPTMVFRVPTSLSAAQVLARYHSADGPADKFESLALLTLSRPQLLALSRGGPGARSTGEEPTEPKGSAGGASEDLAGWEMVGDHVGALELLRAGWGEDTL